jgi:hypothetical protein
MGHNPKRFSGVEMSLFKYSVPFLEFGVHTEIRLTGGVGRIVEEDAAFQALELASRIHFPNFSVEDAKTVSE